MADSRQWRFKKSSRSDSGTQCVEVALDGEHGVFRDSKNPEGGVLVFTSSQLRAFLDGVKHGECDA